MNVEGSYTRQVKNSLPNEMLMEDVVDENIIGINSKWKKTAKK